VQAEGAYWTQSEASRVLNTAEHRAVRGRHRGQRALQLERSLYLVALCHLLALRSPLRGLVARLARCTNLTHVFKREKEEPDVVACICDKRRSLAYAVSAAGWHCLDAHWWTLSICTPASHACARSCAARVPGGWRSTKTRLASRRHSTYALCAGVLLPCCSVLPVRACWFGCRYNSIIIPLSDLAAFLMPHTFVPSHLDALSCANALYHLLISAFSSCHLHHHPALRCLTACVGAAHRGPATASARGSNAVTAPALWSCNAAFPSLPYFMSRMAAVLRTCVAFMTGRRCARFGRRNMTCRSRRVGLCAWTASPFRFFTLFNTYLPATRSACTYRGALAPFSTPVCLQPASHSLHDLVTTCHSRSSSSPALALSTISPPALASPLISGRLSRRAALARSSPEGMNNRQPTPPRNYSSAIWR